jgi:predicted nucleic acid-binding protein
MKYLLDVSVIVALLWKSHVDHSKAQVWCENKELVVCPLSELGFLRVTTSPAFGATMEQARETLETWLIQNNPAFIPADIRALNGEIAPSSAKTTDWYFGNLAQRHGMQWATLDVKANHPSAVVIQ